MDKMYPDGQETIRFNWKFPAINIGEPQECVFYQVMHMKQMFELLKEKNLLKQTRIVDLKKVFNKNANKASTQ